MRRSRAPASLAACAALALLALQAPRLAAESVIDIDAVDNPRSILLSDGRAQSRWQALFEPNPSWVARQVAFLVWRVPDKISTLLAARLLYSGEPWTRRENDPTNERRWHLSDLDTRSVILREIRWQNDPALADVLAHLLEGEKDEGEKDPTLVKSALVDLWQLQPARAIALAVRLGDPQVKDHLPASEVPTNRQNALSFLFDTTGPASPASHQVLAWALLHATGTERNHGIASMPRGSSPDLLKPAIIALAEEESRGGLDDEGREGLVLASSRLGSEIDAELAKALVEIAVGGTREIATAAATALAVNVSWQTSVPIAPIAERAAHDPDPVVRDALLNLLLRLNPDAAATAGGPASPWTALADHRRRLQKWEWEQYVK